MYLKRTHARLVNSYPEASSLPTRIRLPYTQKAQDHCTIRTSITFEANGAGFFVPVSQAQKKRLQELILEPLRRLYQILELLLDTQEVESAIGVRVAGVPPLKPVGGERWVAIKEVVDTKGEGCVGEPIAPTPV